MPSTASRCSPSTRASSRTASATTWRAPWPATSGSSVSAPAPTHVPSTRGCCWPSRGSMSPRPRWRTWSPGRAAPGAPPAAPTPWPGCRAPGSGGVQHALQLVRPGGRAHGRLQGDGRLLVELAEVLLEGLHPEGLASMLDDLLELVGAILADELLHLRRLHEDLLRHGAPLAIRAGQQPL